MRASTRTTALVASALVLAACTTNPDDAPPPSAPTTGTPSQTATGTPTSPTASGPRATVPTDAPADVLLPAEAWAPVTGPREESEGTTAWHLPEACGGAEPEDAVAMRTAAQGDGADEAQVGVQQVAVFDDADLAAAAATRLADALAACAEQGGAEGAAYAVEPLDVGAQGTGFATDYYGAGEVGDPDAALGTYLATTRRGTAVTLVALDGGESTVGAARETVTGTARAAWDLLCRYDEAGC